MNVTGHLPLFQWQPSLRCCSLLFLPLSTLRTSSSAAATHHAPPCCCSPFHALLAIIAKRTCECGLHEDFRLFWMSHRFIPGLDFSENSCPLKWDVLVLTQWAWQMLTPDPLLVSFLITVSFLYAMPLPTCLFVILDIAHARFPQVPMQINGPIPGELFCFVLLPC